MVVKDKKGNDVIKPGLTDKDKIKKFNNK